MIVQLGGKSNLAWVSVSAAQGEIILATAGIHVGNQVPCERDPNDRVSRTDAIARIVNVG